MTRPPFSQYIKAAVSQLNAELCTLDTFMLSAINDRSIPVDEVVSLPILTPSMDPVSVARSLVKEELSRRKQTFEWSKAKIAAASAVTAAALSTVLSVSSG